MLKFIALAAIAAVLVTQPAFAGETAQPEPVRIEIDQQSKAFIFIIDDEPVAMLDKNGLNVVEHIGYGGALTDKGREGVRREIAQRDEGRGDE